MTQLAAVPEAKQPLRLDIGCGKNKKEGFVGIDQYEMVGVDVLCDLRQEKWKFSTNPFGENARQITIGADPAHGKLEGWTLLDNSVEEVHCSHFIEHLTAAERVHFFNELYRVMAPDAKATIITPHWASNRAYGDPTHQWPPVSEMSFYYLSKKWRETEAPHTDIKFNKDGFSCNFEATWGYGLHPTLNVRNTEFQQFAIQFYKEAAQDTHATLTKRV